MDLVLKLRELRRVRGLTQEEAARRAHVGMKTLSSFESGARIGSMKLSQLMRLLDAYGLAPATFFDDEMFDQMVAPLVSPEIRDAEEEILAEVRSLPAALRERLLSCFRIVLDTARNETGPSTRATHSSRPALAPADEAPLRFRSLSGGSR